MTETVGPAKSKIFCLALYQESLLTSVLESDRSRKDLNQVCLVPKPLAALYPVVGCSCVCNIPVLAAHKGFLLVPLREVSLPLTKARSESAKGFGESDLPILRPNFGRKEEPK